METTSSFGYWVRRQRKALDLTQQALAERVGCSLAAIKKIESDERRPSRQIAELLAEVLGVSEDQRELFLEVARGLRSADQLSLAGRPVTPSRPSGTVTFLFTDIEGSTKLAQEYADELPVLLVRHREILNQAITAYDGFIFQVVGDALAAAFNVAMNALKAAIDAQRLLQKETWSFGFIKVRMGIHTGAVQWREEPKETFYEGYTTLALTQRIMSAAHGGQVLLSYATENLLRGQLPMDIHLRDLGEHKFKDILQPVRVFQLIAPDLQNEFPPLRALDVMPNNLPTQLTSFIGREKELAEAKKLLRDSQMLTLTGPGGTGKTRLSLKIAQEVLPEFTDGVWWVELAPLMDPALIPQTIASVFKLREAPKASLMEILINYLHTKQLVLILDNCEHLIEACAKLSNQLLQACPQLKIIASSREALGISGETIYRVPPLSLPNLLQATPEALMESEAGQLFIERAMAVHSHFALQRSNASAVAQICYRLDGIPLALELAAARIAVFSPEEIAARLDDCFRLLIGGSRTALERHQTLRALIDWSYDLLSNEEQRLFRQLSVFTGDWTFEAAEAVCSELDVLNLLTQLVNKSLVLVQENAKVTRYRVPETIRQYAHDKLLDSGESNRLRDRHLDYFLHFAEVAEPHLRKVEQIEWLNHLDTEHENLRAALTWAMDQPAAELALRLVGALGTFWGIRAYWLEGAKWMDQALEKKWQENDESEKAARGKVFYCRATLAEYLDEVSILHRCAESALKLCTEVNDRWGIAYARAMVALHMIQVADYNTSKMLLEQSLSEFRHLGDAWGESIVLGRLNIVEANLGQVEKYSESLQSALTQARISGDRERIARSLLNIASYLLFHSEWDRVEKLLQEAEHLFAEIGSTNGINQIRFNRARVFLARGKLEEAKTELKLFIDWCLLVGEKNMQARSLLFLALIAEIENNVEGAIEHLYHGLSAVKDTGLSNALVEILAFLGRLEYQQGHHDATGQNMSKSWEFIKSDQVGGEEVLFVICQLSGMLVETKPMIAVQLLASTEAFWQLGRFPRNPTFDQPFFERFLSTARTKLSESDFNMAWEAGLKLSEEQVFALVANTSIES